MTLILIPPSEGKSKGGQGKPKPVPKLSKPVLAEISKTKDWSKFLGVKNTEEFAYINTHIEQTPTMPAINRYTGVVYDGISYQTLTQTQKKWAQDHLKIISAVYGLVKPNDEIANYKVKIDHFAKYWKQHLIIDEPVIDLLPQSHKKAITFTNATQVEFIFLKDGKKKPAGHFGKLIKGKYVRYLIQNKGKNMEKFSEDGWKLYKKEKQKIIYAKNG